MTKDGNRYFAEEGKFIVRKEDGFIMGESIDLGTEDFIKNYEENAYTEEEYNAFYESIGVQKTLKNEEKIGNKRTNKNNR